MYTLFRKIHLYSGLVVLLFVLLYFVSGYVMIHHNWFGRSDPVVTTFEAPFDARGERDPDRLSRHIQQRVDLQGKRLPPNRLEDGRWRFRYIRPGTTYDVEMTPDQSTVRITQRTMDWSATLIGLHRLHGYGGGAFYTLWALLYDLVSLSMIVFALTGIYLWYTLTKKRRLGWILLAVTWAYALGTIGYLMLAP